jgi:hypothetical protein
MVPWHYVFNGIRSLKSDPKMAKLMTRCEFYGLGHHIVIHLNVRLLLPALIRYPACLPGGVSQMAPEMRHLYGRRQGARGQITVVAGRAPLASPPKHHKPASMGVVNSG